MTVMCSWLLLQVAAAVAVPEAACSTGIISGLLSTGGGVPGLLSQPASHQCVCWSKMHCTVLHEMGCRRWAQNRMGIGLMLLTCQASRVVTSAPVDSACAGINALLASPALKRAELCNLMSLKQLLLQDPEQRLELLYVAGCKMLTTLRVLSPSLTSLNARSCYRLQARSQAVACSVAY